jgi:hypothetical protein
MFSCTFSLDDKKAESRKQKAENRKQKTEGILHGIKYSLKQRSEGQSLSDDKETTWMIRLVAYFV